VALIAFHNFKFDFLPLFQGAKPLARNVAVMDKDVSPIFPGNETEPLGIAEPFDLASYSHEPVTSNEPPATGRGAAGKNKENDRKRSLSGKPVRVFKPLIT
jgi:hypothetical protein